MPKVSLYNMDGAVAGEMELSDAEFARVSRVVSQFTHSPNQYHYNFLGLFCVALDILLNRQRHFLCSQFVAYVLQRSKIVDFPKEFSLVTPRDFYAIKNKRLVYCGRLSQNSCN